jgi:hypothetical protein
MKTFELWLAFALGQASLGGNRIIHPTGRYAASLHYKKFGFSKVAIIADERYAPEARILETGHAAVDLLTKLQPGRAYPMHRWGGWKAPITTPLSRRRGKRLWAVARAQSESGFARVPKTRRAAKMNTSGTAAEWIIPAMPAYAPGRILRNLLEQTYGVP